MAPAARISGDSCTTQPPGMWHILEADVRDDWSEQMPADIDRQVEHVLRARCLTKTGERPEYRRISEHCWK
jgi:hypothetical protein